MKHAIINYSTLVAAVLLSAAGCGEDDTISTASSSSQAGTGGGGQGGATAQGGDAQGGHAQGGHAQGGGMAQGGGGSAQGGGPASNFEEGFEGPLDAQIWGDYYAAANFPGNNFGSSAVTPSMAMVHGGSSALLFPDSIVPPPLLTLNVTVPAGGATLSFWYSVNFATELPTGNHFALYDNVMSVTWADSASVVLDETSGWQQVNYNLNAGQHDLMWKMVVLAPPIGGAAEGFIDDLTIEPNQGGAVVVNPPISNPN